MDIAWSNGKLVRGPWYGRNTGASARSGTETRRPRSVHCPARMLRFNDSLVLNIESKKE